MDRRQMLKGSAQLVSGFSFLNITKTLSANDRINTAIIGMGWRGGQLLPVFAKTPKVHIAVLCDPDENRMNEWNEKLNDITGSKAQLTPDMRDIMQNDNIDAVVIATPNHWHALAAIWGSQNGKHSYVEKPVCHAVQEGKLMVDAVRKHNRISQGGPQRRSSDLFKKAIDRIHNGDIGDVYMAKALVLKSRESLGFKPVKQPPKTLHWDLWKGPGPDVGYHENLVHYNWHWFWDFGNGELGNNGIHLLDVCRWGLNRGLPTYVRSNGGRFGYDDQGETPNVQHAVFEYEDGTILQAETRGLPTNTEGEIQTSGVIFYGSQGYLVADSQSARIYMGNNKEPDEVIEGNVPSDKHVHNFVDAVSSGNRSMLNAELEEIYLSSCYPLLANISYRLNRELNFDPKAMKFINDEQANNMLSCQYRAPYSLPETM